MADGVEAIPRLAECEAKLLVVPDRALKVVDKKLWSEGRDARLHRGCSHRCLLSSGIAVGRPVARAPPHRSRRAVFPHRALQQSSLPHKVQLAETASLIRGRGRIRGRGSWKCCSSARKLAQL